MLVVMHRLGGLFAHGCGRTPPADAWDRGWLVCAACLPDFVPRCQMCSAPSPVLYEQGGFLVYAWAVLCTDCTAMVQAAGPWKLRRASANAARAATLIEHFPSLSSRIDARTTHVEGHVAGRAVHVRLRLAPRAFENERYVFHVGYRGPIESVAHEALHLDPRFADKMVPASLKVTHDRGRWLRVAWLHLGRLDTVRVLENLLEATARLERGLPC